MKHIKNSLGVTLTAFAGLFALWNGINLSEAYFFRFVIVAIISVTLGNISWSNRLLVKVPAIIVGLVILPFFISSTALNNASNWDLDNIFVYLMFALGSGSYWLSVIVCNMLRTQTTDHPETPEER